ncbi:MAG: asparagine synthase (glutamine-hydrolyzing) [Candidatus Magasanikbacteria bacterium]|nr:asparagine synthase (glutamine-hydrolyzing) [Candidatus Magasanikbacteria bacterium]
MCGINGFNLRDEGLVKKMNHSTKHRGPDDDGLFLSKEWSLGHVRLAILDTSTLGHQPMHNKAGNLVIVFNGEIYNFQEIRCELEEKGYSFISKTDTEVVLSAYEEWGEECLQKFNGMFAFAILDIRTEELFIARDRMGIKPLYYYKKGNKFIFSSEVKAIFTHSGLEKELNYNALNIYFRLLYVPGPQTMWANVYKLEPGCFAKIKNGNLAIQSYWSIEKKECVTDKVYIESEIKRLLCDSVKKRTISDRPLGVFLSGGIDSTIITGIMSSFSEKVNTFSAKFEKTPQSEKYNKDAEIAKRTAKYFGTNHHELVLSGKEVLESLEDAVFHMDEPISNHIQAVNMLLAKYTSKHVKVVLGGDGADELFGGYERYYYNNVIDSIQKHIPKCVLSSPLMKFGLHNLGKKEAFNKINRPPGVYRYTDFFSQKEKDIQTFLLPKYNRPNVLQDTLVSKCFKSVERESFTRQFMCADTATWLPDESLVRSDKMSMAAGLEQRVPFLDHRLVEFADRIPLKYKLGKKGVKFMNAGTNYQGKRILVSSMEEYLPDFVLEQPKWGWFSPASKWLRGPMHGFAKEVLSEGYCAQTSEFFDFKAISEIFDKHVSGEVYALNTLWSIMTFQMWYRRFMLDNI